MSNYLSYIDEARVGRIELWRRIHYSPDSNGPKIRTFLAFDSLDIFEAPLVDSELLWRCFRSGLLPTLNQAMSVTRGCPVKSKHHIQKIFT